MAKRFKVKPILNISGKAMQVPSFGDDGIAKVDEQGRLVNKDADLADIVDLLIRAFPGSQLTMDNITHGSRIKEQIETSRKNKDGYFVIEEAEHDWVIKMLRHDEVGPKILGFNLLKVIEAFDDFERPHEKQTAS
jgi:hypothetical protein